METNTAFFSETRKRNRRLAGLATGAGAIATLAVVSAPEPAQASVEEVSTTVTAIGGIAAAAGSIAIVAMGIRLAIKQVNRVMTKA